MASRAWTGMESHIYRTESVAGFLISQQFVGEVLRRLDLKEYPNIGALVACTTASSTTCGRHCSQ